jgi:hypothetical protein
VRAPVAENERCGVLAGDDPVEADAREDHEIVAARKLTLRPVSKRYPVTMIMRCALACVLDWYTRSVPRGWGS